MGSSWWIYVTEVCGLWLDWRRRSRFGYLAPRGILGKSYICRLLWTRRRPWRGSESRTVAVRLELPAFLVTVQERRWGSPR